MGLISTILATGFFKVIAHEEDVQERLIKVEAQLVDIVSGRQETRDKIAKIEQQTAVAAALATRNAQRQWERN